MRHYWKINRKVFYIFLLIGCIIFMVSLFHLKKSGKPLFPQLLFNILVSFGILGFLYFVLFLVSFNKFQETKRFFTGPLFASLPSDYKVIETSPAFIFLAGLTIRGQSGGYPVRIEYEKEKVIIVIGVEPGKQNLQEIQNVLVDQNLIIEPLGVIKEIRLADIDPSKPDLNSVIEGTTAYLKQIGLAPFNNYR